MPVDLIVGTNSYLNVTEANEYFATRFRSDIWNGGSDDEKAQALITATRQIDRLPLKGRKLVISQKLAFPRYEYRPVNCLDCYTGDPTLTFLESAVSDRIKHAVCEEAICIMTGNKRMELQQQGVQSFTIGNISETYKPGKIRLFSPEARELLRPYIIGSVRIT